MSPENRTGDYHGGDPAQAALTAEENGRRKKAELFNADYNSTVESRGEEGKALFVKCQAEAAHILRSFVQQDDQSLLLQHLSADEEVMLNELRAGMRGPKGVAYQLEGDQLQVYNSFINRWALDLFKKRNKLQAGQEMPSVVAKSSVVKQDQGKQPTGSPADFFAGLGKGAQEGRIGDIFKHRLRINILEQIGQLPQSDQDRIKAQYGLGKFDTLDQAKADFGAVMGTTLRLQYKPGVLDVACEVLFPMYEKSINANDKTFIITGKGGVKVDLRKELTRKELLIMYFGEQITAMGGSGGQLFSETIKDINKRFQ